MMYYDRFDILVAYHHFVHSPVRTKDSQHAKDINRAKCYYANRLDKIRYKLGLSDSNLGTISPNAKAIYMSLVRKFVGVHSTVKKMKLG